MFESLEALETMVEDIVNGGNGQKEIQVILDQLNKIESGEELSEPISSSNTSNVQTNLNLDEFELTVVEQASAQGQNIFDITIRLMKTVY